MTDRPQFVFLESSENPASIINISQIAIVDRDRYGHYWMKTINHNGCRIELSQEDYQIVRKALINYQEVTNQLMEDNIKKKENENKSKFQVTYSPPIKSSSSSTNLS